MPPVVSSNVTLSELKEGSVEEMYQAELARVLANIADPNTKPDAKREITLKFKFQPDERRSMTMVDVTAESKLAAQIPVETVFTLKEDKGHHLAWENVQEKLFDKNAN